MSPNHLRVYLPVLFTFAVITAALISAISCGDDGGGNCNDSCFSSNDLLYETSCLDYCDFDSNNCINSNEEISCVKNAADCSSCSESCMTHDAPGC